MEEIYGSDGIQHPNHRYNGLNVIKEDFTIVIPVLNEEEGIGRVINDVKEEGYFNILVIDGYSTDDTVTVANQNGVRVIYQHGIGKTGAIKTAIENVTTPYFVVMDGDCTYDPRDIINLLPHLDKNNEVIGTRTSGRKNIPLLNRFGNWVINTTFNVLFGTNLIDVCSGMYALKRDFAEQVDLRTRGFDVEVEIAAQAAIDGRIAQVPITYRERVGHQKLRPFKHGIQIFSSLWKLARSYNPVFLFSALTALTMIPAVITLFWVIMDWLRGVWHTELAIFGLILLIISLFAFTLSTLSTLLKRMEQRMVRRFRTP